MAPRSLRRITALIVLALVVTSFPARVWLFGACPVCGQIHEKILLVQLGGDARTPGSTDDPPGEDDRSPDGCFPPLPYCPTAAPLGVAIHFEIGDSVRVQSDSQIASVPASALIRPPRA